MRVSFGRNREPLALIAKEHPDRLTGLAAIGRPPAGRIRHGRCRPCWATASWNGSAGGAANRSSGSLSARLIEHPAPPHATRRCPGGAANSNHARSPSRPKPDRFTIRPPWSILDGPTTGKGPADQPAAAFNSADHRAPACSLPDGVAKPFMGAPLAEWIGRVVEVEGPMRLDEATLRVHEAAGVARSSSRIRKQMKVGWRGSCGATPASPARFLKASFGIEPREAVHEARRLFGFMQAGRKIVARFRHVLQKVRSAADRLSLLRHRNPGASSRPRRFGCPTVGDLR